MSITQDPPGVHSSIHPLPPLSELQQQMIFLGRLDPGSTTYQDTMAFRIAGPLDVPALRAAVNEVVRRHDVLRTIFSERSDGVPTQVILSESDVPWGDLWVDPQLNGPVGLAALVRQWALTPIELTAGLPLRAGLVESGADEHVLLVTVHHVAFDGASRAVFLTEVQTLYAAYASGEPSPLAPLQVSYHDYWSRHADVAEEDVAYWRQRLAGAPEVLALPTDYERPPVASSAGAVVRLYLPPDLVSSVAALAGRESVTPFSVLLAGFNLLMARYSGHDDIVVGSVVLNRSDEVTTPLIGCFANTVALRTDLSGCPSFREVLRRTWDTLIKGLDHHGAPLRAVVEAVDPRRDPSYAPLIQVLFSAQLHNDPFLTWRLPGVDVEILDVPRTTSKFDLTIDVSIVDGAVLAEIEYSTELFEESTIHALGAHWVQLLSSAVANPELGPHALRMLGEAEWEQTVGRGAGSEDVSTEGTLHQLFEEQAALTPESTAVIDDKVRLSYRELNEQADRLAALLRARGAGPDVPVGVCLSSSADGVIAFLAVQKSGGAFLPLDPEEPPDRLRFIIGDAGPRLVITTLDHVIRFAPGTPMLCLDQPDLSTGGQAADVAYSHGQDRVPDAGTAKPSGANLSCAIYAADAGPTPECVMLTHANVVHYFAAWKERYLDRVPPGVHLHWAGFSFDLFVADIARSLLVGATLLVASRDEAMSASALYALLLRERVTSAEFTTPLFMALLEHVEQVGGSLEGFDVLTAAAPTWQAVDHRSVRALCGPDTLFLSVHGATEVGIDACTEVWEPGSSSATRYVRIGRPLPGTRCYILDQTGQPVPISQTGELYIAGAGVGRGYLARPGLTAERFVPDPYSRHPGARMYRSGQVARLRRDGVLELAGRSDGSVSVNARPFELDDTASMLPVAGGPTARFVPANATEACLKEILCDVLGRPEIDLDADVLTLGCGSMILMQILVRIRRALGTELRLRELYESPTIGMLASRIAEEMRSRGTAVPLQRVVNRPVRIPLSFAQQRLWFIDQLNPGDPTYTSPTGYLLHGPLNVPALAEAFRRVVARHEVLRIVVTVGDGAPYQVIRPVPEQWHLPVVDLTELTAEEQQAALQKLSEEDERRGFALHTGPLVRTMLVRLAVDEHALLITMHHIVTDGWSERVLLNELGELYPAAVAGRLEAAVLPELPVQYTDYAVWQNDPRQEPIYKAQLDYWRARLQGAPPTLDLPLDRPRPSRPRHRGARVEIEVAEHDRRRLVDLAATEGASLYQVLLATFAAMLARWSGQEDIVVGCLSARRPFPELERLVGFFVNTLPLRCDVGIRKSLREVLRGVRDAAVDAFSHDDVPFEQIVAAAAPQRRANEQPLFQVMFDMAEETGPAVLGDLRMRPLARGKSLSHFDLVLTMAEHTYRGWEPGGAVLTGVLEYNPDLIERATAARMASAIVSLLSQFGRDPDQSVGALELLDAVERAAVVKAGEGPALGRFIGRLDELIRRRALISPDSAALVTGGDVVTYAELITSADALAAELMAAGVGPDVCVGICLEISSELVTAVVAVMCAGGAVLLLDPRATAEKNAGLLLAAKAPLVLTTTDLTHGVAGFPGIVVRCDANKGQEIGEAAEQFAGRPAEQPVAHPDHLAAVVFTSGTTKQSRAVALTHRALAGHIASYLERLPISRTDRVLLCHSPTFDVALEEILVPLVAGATLVAEAQPLRLGYHDLGQLLARQRVTIVDFPTAYLTGWAAEGFPADSEGFPTLRRVSMGGEAVSRRALKAWKDRFGETVEWVNAYGPAEAVITCSTYHAGVDWTKECRRGVPIGRPMAGSAMFVLDDQLRPVPVGVPGELYLRRPELPRGYLDRPAETAAAYLPDPFGPVGGRLYRTGDLARWTEDGWLEWVGRRDRQVKVRGHRVDLDEVAEVLMLHPWIASAAVLIHEDQDARARLVAYVVGSGPEIPPPSILREWLATRLSSPAMVSDHVVLDEMPLTPQGKINEHALRQLPLSAVRSDGQAGAPCTQRERQIAEIWTELLGVEDLARDANIFDLGADSLLAARIASRVKARLGIRAPVRLIFDCPTVAGYAAALEEAPATTGGEAMPVRRAPGRRTYPMSRAQERLWVIEQMALDGALYTIPTAVRIHGRLDVDALREALSALMQRHEVLRTVFRVESGRVVQQVLDGPENPMALHDWSEWDDAEQRARLNRLLTEEAGQGFDLANGPVIRVRVIRLAREQHVLVVTVHHIAFDGFSDAIFWNELAQLYRAGLNGSGATLPELPMQYGDYALWQSDWVASDEHQRQLAYWLRQLEGAPPVLELCPDRARPAVVEDAADILTVTLPGPLAEGLPALAARHGVSDFTVFFTAFAKALAQVAGQDDVVIGTPVAARTPPETEALIGFFANTLAVRVRVPEGASDEDLLRSVRGTLLESYDNANVPFELLVSALDVQRSVAHSPVFQVMFVYENQSEGPADWPGIGQESLAVETLPVAQPVAKFDLSLSMRGVRGALEETWLFRSNLYEEYIVRLVVDAFHDALRRLFDASEVVPAE